ncbi:DUF2190 family protein [Brevundimonas diminuta]|uniref:DUF2190 family protein n=1 Tax=Brevundimonas diminuta TaxID=293 RepID=UPI00168A656E|nr:DUF2190 family protein [Brevundimonas diminuta]MBD3571698.1 DUF2190 family protein [Brevundimonas diminuta]MCZ4109540.1 DUF2190 family protein [Brevundimonas diminuta]
MKTYIQKGDILDFITPAGGAVAGVPLIIEKAFIIPASTTEEGEPNSGAVEGVYELPASGAAAAQFAPAYWDTTAGAATGAATGNTKIGYFTDAKAGNAATIRVKLIPAA